MLGGKKVGFWPRADCFIGSGGSPGVFPAYDKHVFSKHIFAYPVQQEGYGGQIGPGRAPGAPRGARSNMRSVGQDRVGHSIGSTRRLRSRSKSAVGR